MTTFVVYDDRDGKVIRSGDVTAREGVNILDLQKFEPHERRAGTESQLTRTSAGDPGTGELVPVDSPSVG